MAKQMSEKEKARILELYAQGFCRQDIARDLHRAPSSVTKFLAKQPDLPKQKERNREDLLKRDPLTNTPACCEGCAHRRKAVTNCAQTYCWYANDMESIGRPGEPRGCPVEECTHYQRRKN